MKKVIITGAAGGIGQALTNRLLKAGYQVREFFFPSKSYTRLR